MGMFLSSIVFRFNSSCTLHRLTLVTCSNYLTNLLNEIVPIILFANLYQNAFVIKVANLVCMFSTIWFLYFGFGMVSPMKNNTSSWVDAQMSGSFLWHFLVFTICILFYYFLVRHIMSNFPIGTWFEIINLITKTYV
jgi:hypothetical protein